MNILSALLILVSSLAWSVPEETLEQNWKKKIYAHFQSMKSESFTNPQGLTIRYFYKVSPASKKTIVIAPGRTEPAAKYAELIYDLKKVSANIFIIDHQGQGKSSRILKDTHKGHVVSFSHYVNDFAQFIDIVRAKTSTPLYLIAHSMGGAITTRFMARNPDAFTKAVLVAPMLEMNTAPYSETVARYYSKLLVTIGKGNNYAPDYGPYKPENDQYENNPYTHSEPRFNVSKFLFTNWNELIVGGPTARWVHESLKATKGFDQLTVKTPVLMFQAGQDLIVKPGRQNSFCKKGLCEIIHIPDAKHEILMERDAIRDDVLETIRLFFVL